MSIQKRENPVQNDILEIDLADLDKVMQETKSEQNEKSPKISDTGGAEEKINEPSEEVIEVPKEEPEPPKKAQLENSGQRLPGKITKKFSGKLVEKILEGMIDEAYIKEAVSLPSGEIYLINKKTGQMFLLEKGKIAVLGTDPNQVSLYIDGNNTVSRRHGEISISSDGDVYYKDVGSRNGSQINGIPLESGEVYSLSSGDELVLSNEPFVLEKGDGNA